MRNIFQILRNIILVLFLNMSLVFSNQDNIAIEISWMDLLPEDVFDFVPEGGVTDEMWDDPEFIKNLEKAGLAIVPELDGKYIRIIGINKYLFVCIIKSLQKRFSIVIFMTAWEMNY